jgi:AraC-like DNA-binding protein
MKNIAENCLITGIVLAHRFSSPPGWVSEEYKGGRNRHGMIFILDGKANYELSNHPSFVAQKGNLLYMPSQSSYTTRCFSDAPFVHMTVNFHTQGDAQLDMLPMHMHLSNPAKIETLFAQLVAAWNRRRPLFSIQCMGLLYELIYAAHLQSAREHETYRRKLEPAIRCLEQDGGGALPPEGLHALCGMSQTYFRRLFMRVYKESPTAYRTRLRIGRACDLLLSGQYTVEQAAVLTGYEDAAYFSRVFKKTMGESPSQFRISHLGE